MIKKQFAFAVALLLISASHAESGVTLYGIIDSGLLYQNISGNSTYSAARAGLSSGSQTTSRWGMRGAEDLGAGYSVNFTLESSFETNDGALLSGGRIFGLQSWIGATKQDLGYVRFGRQSSFALENFLPIDPFRGGFGQARMAMAFGSSNSNTKYSNLLKVMVEPIHGLKVGAGYSFAPQMNTTYYNGVTAISATAADYNFNTMNNTRLITLGMNYTSGPLVLAASFDQVMPDASAQVPDALSRPGNIREWILGGKYEIDWMVLSFAFGQNAGGTINNQAISATSNGKASGDGVSWGGGQGSIMFDPDMRYNAVMLGATFPLGAASKIFTSWTQAHNTGSSNAAAGVSSQNIYSVGYQYDLSKRTDLYAATSYATNAGFVSGVNSYLLVSGLRHRF